MARFFYLNLLASLGLLGCSPLTEDEARRAEIINVMTSADEPFLRTRPNLMGGKYERMAASPYDFFRGTVPLSWNDYQNNRYDLASSSFALDGPLAPVLGDPHPENFGTLLGADGTLGFEPNDFDSSDFAPYLWDVRRLTTGMALAAQLTNPEDPVARQTSADAARLIARTAAEAYAQAIFEFSKGNAPNRITAAEDPILADVFEKADEESVGRTELTELTSLENGQRRLVRGAIDPLDPTEKFLDLPPWAIAALPDTLARYRQTLLNPPEPNYFELLDAVRVLGSGVSSWARVRVVLLVRGPTDDPSDDVLLELKELTDSGLGGHYPPVVYYDDVEERIRETSRAAWIRPDAEPLWGTSDWFGFRCQIKRESNAHRTIRIRRLVEERGTPEALQSLARVLGELVARAHCSPPKNTQWAGREIANVISKNAAGFADEQAEAGHRYAARVLADHRLFRAAVEELGPRLGFPVDENDVVAADLAAIFADEQAR